MHAAFIRSTQDGKGVIKSESVCIFCKHFDINIPDECQSVSKVVDKLINMIKQRF